MNDGAAQQDLSAARDFPDGLPPMVVKELRQGLRAKLFGETIAGFHLVLMVLMFPLLNYGQEPEIAGIQRLLWWIFIGVLMLLLPLRGLSALIQERRENTLDTLLLTNLSAGRVVWGKWLAISSQIAVTAISLIPYTIMMYAAGGISLTGSLMALFRLGILAVSLTAAYVALSWNASWVSRAAPALILSWLALTQYAWPMVGTLTSGNASSMEFAVVRLLAEMVAAASLIYLILETTSARLAPRTEDHRTGPRLLGIVLPMILAAGAGHQEWRGILCPGIFVFLTIGSLTALTESWPRIPFLNSASIRDSKSLPGGIASGWPLGVAWALGAWGLMLLATLLWLPDQKDLALRFIAWIFAGRLLLFLLPAARRTNAMALLSTALVFFLLQTALSLAGDLLTMPTLTVLAGSLPGLFPVPGLGTVTRDMSGIAAAAAGSCALLALIAWAKHRRASKEAAP